MNALLSIPPQIVWVSKDSISRPDDHENARSEDFIRGLWHAISIEPNRLIKAHVLFDAGFHYSDLPISKIYHHFNLHEDLSDQCLQPYECLSDQAEIVTLKLLENMTVKVKNHDELGTYLFSVHFLGRNTWMNIPEQRKIFHCIKLETGQFTFQPNNHLLWVDEAVTSANPEWPTYLKANEYE